MTKKKSPAPSKVDISSVPLVVFDNKTYHYEDDDEILRRREFVARLRARKLTAREIVIALRTVPVEADGSGGPIITTIKTVYSDLDLLRSEWRLAAAAHTKEWIAIEVADLEEAEKASWARGDFMALARFKELKHRLLGLGKSNALASLRIDFNKLSTDQIERIINGEDPLQVLVSGDSDVLGLGATIYQPDEVSSVSNEEG